jgi:predicted RNA-binding protein with PIN domain
VESRSKRSSKTWIVDGYNVLRVSLSPRDANGLRGPRKGPRKWWTEERRAALTTIASRLPYPDDEVVLVFDARHLSEAQAEQGIRAPTESPRPLVRHVYAPSADEWIVAAVKERSQPPRTVVVTADRPLANRARHRGAEVMTTNDFVALCGGPAGSPSRD